ncbi:MAG TPA: ABC transporter permease subunit [Tepidisphaeraceae bacterium]|nr:ABC transporter permease subunit [Tepidisphaeraceae bacterium]
MPILSAIESRRPKGRLIQASIFLALTLGAITMLYPFAVMLSGSLRSEMDEAELSLVPKFLVDRDALYRRFLESKYNEDVKALNRSHQSLSQQFDTAKLPKPIAPGLLEDFKEFLTETKIPQHWRLAGAVDSKKNLPERLREIQKMLEARYHGDAEAFGRDMGAPIGQWIALRIQPVPDWMNPTYEYQDNPLYEAYFEAADRAPPAEQQLMNLTGEFLDTQIFVKYGESSTAEYNREHVHPLASFDDFILSRQVPSQEDQKLRDEWLTFVRKDLNPAFVTLVNVPATKWRTFLQTKYQSIEQLNKSWNASIRSFDQIALPAGEWLRGAKRLDYAEFLQAQLPESYRLVGPEFAWWDWLARKHAAAEMEGEAPAEPSSSPTTQAARQEPRPPERLNAPMPMENLEYEYVTQNASFLRWTFGLRNFRFVFGELLLQGNGLRNTMILCALAVAVACLINPLAAYAMSRYRLAGTYNILLILMATVAFPPMVTLIPNFILLREAGLLNTFAALVLPFAANGYLIFLLKSFFDSLPRELYEAAAIDGASELRIFWQITMSLSKPILAVVALDAFNAAYTMFLYALIVCPRPDMWVQTVWLSQFQTRAPMGAVFASVLVMCIPTLLIFIFAQRIIIRGIVVPTEK